ncbi:MAG TPA: tetratricopeptide repeat protein [Blastocatellia bacterium]|nr:tetratricopeptide repeat protein [Blastocatellia bacterium]
MNLIDLQTAVTEIMQACARSEGTPRSPFFFVVGAGISCPSIPIASELVAQFKEVARKYGKEAELQSSKGIDEYAYWFQAAFPQRIDRRDFLRRLMENKPITHANLRLAHLLLARTITNLVVTPNFDDFLTKSLQMFGKYHIICDHPKTVERIDHEQDDVQIVHVHGTYSFYDCCNLKGEVERQARPLDDRYTMGFLLDHILFRRSPLVIGYSGWEGDVIMTALKKRLDQGSLPRRIYWFCHRRADADQLPRWLRERGIRGDDDVCFVGRNEEEGVSLSAQRLATMSALEFPRDLTRGQPPLTAEDVFAVMIKAFGLTQPLLTSDPLGFYAEQLRAWLPNISAQSEDIYFIPNVIKTIERAKALEAEATDRTRSEAALEEVRAAVRRADYRDAISKAAAIMRNPSVSTGINANELMDAVWLATRGLSDNPKQRLDGYDLIILSCKVLLRRETALDLRARLATVLVEKGLTLGQLNRNEEALRTYDEVVSRFGEAAEPVLLGELGRALINKANLLAQLNRNEEAIGLYDEVLKRFGESVEPVLCEAVARALNNRGATLATVDRLEEAFASFDDVVKRFGEAEDVGLRVEVVGALVRKGQWLITLERYEEAVLVFDDVLQRVGTSRELALCDELGCALVKKAAALLALRRSEEAIALLNEVVEHFGEASETTLQEHVAFALFGKGIILHVTGHNEEAVAAYDELMKRFGQATTPALQRQVADALVNKANSLKVLCRAEEAASVYDEVVRLFGDATDPGLRGHVASALVNKGITLAALNRSEEAVVAYDEAVKRFGEAAEPAVRDVVANARKALQTLGDSIEEAVDPTIS